MQHPWDNSTIFYQQVKMVLQLEEVTAVMAVTEGHLDIEKAI